ncbi:MAG: alkylmercury lyase family protein [Acidimicrobiia bacterium]|nr:alkylmercury lyase family protein [Acidimicrobiia bacterium]NNL70621.1 hypothetical protein [Acidimicrobiia bacterium]
MDSRDAAIRLFVYEEALAGAIPTPAQIGVQFSLTPQEAGDALRRLQDDHDALVLLPGSSYIWMAEPFSAVASDYPVLSGNRRWYGNCIWDALAIAALAGDPCRIPAVCPQSGAALDLEVRDGELVRATGVVHFAVPPRRWWESIGFT